MTGFNWKKAQKRTLAKNLYRLERELLTRHPEKLVTMPEEVKICAKSHKLPQHCVDKLTREHSRFILRATMPAIERPKRLSHG